MSASPGEQTWTVDEVGVTIRRVIGERLTRSPEPLLRRLLATVSGVPEADVELEHRCAECGARHGAPTVEYPLLPSGRRWYADLAAGDGVVVAAVCMRHPLGVAVEGAGPEGRLIDEAAFHAAELARLSALSGEERRIARDAMWARKAALARALGHRSFLEPARVELTVPGDDGGTARLVRGLPELGVGWRHVRVQDVPVGGGLAAAVAILAR